MPDAQNADGVAVWRSTYWGLTPTWTNGDEQWLPKREPWRAFSEAEAAALVDVAEAARELLDCDPMSDRFHDRLLVLRKLDAARAAK